MSRFFERFVMNQSGATAIEYGLIGVLIAVAIISGASSIGSTVNNMLTSQSTRVTAAGS